jgi:hypothetical protein
VWRPALRMRCVPFLNIWMNVNLSNNSCDRGRVVSFISFAAKIKETQNSQA